MSSEKFESLEDDLQAVLDDVKAKENKISGLSGGKRNCLAYYIV
jgi:hypothetical protein